MIKPNPGGCCLWNQKRFKVYTSSDEEYAKKFDEAFPIPKRDKSKCCGWGVKIVFPPNKPKVYVCHKCGKECEIE